MNEECPLSSVPIGTFCKIQRIECPSEECARRILEMGFCKNREIQVLSSNYSLVCKTCSFRVGISKKLAESIIVELVENEKGI